MPWNQPASARSSPSWWAPAAERREPAVAAQRSWGLAYRVRPYRCFGQVRNGFRVGGRFAVTDSQPFVSWRPVRYRGAETGRRDHGDPPSSGAPGLPRSRHVRVSIRDHVAGEEPGRSWGPCWGCGASVGRSWGPQWGYSNSVGPTTLLARVAPAPRATRAAEPREALSAPEQPAPLAVALLCSAATCLFRPVGAAAFAAPDAADGAGLSVRPLDLPAPHGAGDLARLPDLGHRLDRLQAVQQIVVCLIRGAAAPDRQLAVVVPPAAAVTSSLSGSSGRSPGTGGRRAILHRNRCLRSGPP